jgi:hypothetical protein
MADKDSPELGLGRTNPQQFYTNQPKQPETQETGDVHAMD